MPTQDSLAVNYGMYDPYFLQALNSPNYYQLQSATNTQPQADQNSIMTKQQDTNTQTSFKGKSEKEGNKGGAIFLTAASIIIPSALYVISKGKSGKWFSKQRWSNGLKAIRDDIGKLFNKKGVTFGKENDKWYAKVGNQKQNIRKDVEVNASNLGIDVTKVPDQKNGTLVITHDGKKNILKIKDGNVVEAKSIDSSIIEGKKFVTEHYDFSKANDKFQNDVNTYIMTGKVNEGADFVGNPKFIKRIDLPNGSTAIYNNDILKSVRTDRFALDSDKVLHIANNNSKVDGALKAINGNGNDLANHLKIKNAEYKPNIEGWTHGNIIVDKNKNIVSIVKDGKVLDYNSEGCAKIYRDFNNKLVEALKENNWIDKCSNIVYNVI
ncbi:hypothetical protein J6R97_04635 [bacterium]|nr:hypothetical protein [bacterium]